MCLDIIVTFVPSCGFVSTIDEISESLLNFTVPTCDIKPFLSFHQSGVSRLNNAGRRLNEAAFSAEGDPQRYHVEIIQPSACTQDWPVLYTAKTDISHSRTNSKRPRTLELCAVTMHRA
ncbi:hypothetical protein V5799_020098 [Amblyomma americanum]|uniref:Uncharacterized protein n=1 Tax=Amblyomma americanum TaxID=6943 RepID=A0AAQ4EV15_AMBAM